MRFLAHNFGCREEINIGLYATRLFNQRYESCDLESCSVFAKTLERANKTRFFFSPYVCKIVFATCLGRNKTCFISFSFTHQRKNIVFAKLSRGGTKKQNVLFFFSFTHQRKNIVFTKISRGETKKQNVFFLQVQRKRPNKHRRRAFYTGGGCATLAYPRGFPTDTLGCRFLLEHRRHVTAGETNGAEPMMHAKTITQSPFFVIELGPSTKPGARRCRPRAPAKYRSVGVGVSRAQSVARSRIRR